MVVQSRASDPRPNIVIIIADDLAWGDPACLGNPYTHTPHLDALHASSTRLIQYRSGPMCTPARASLMTGRYPYRTRAFDTYLGRSMLDPGEITLAQILQGAGYHTGIFGKWHLGDCYPLRAIDKGFEEALVHNGGGLRQPGNVTRNDGFFDPDLMHNGKVENFPGYCTDIFTDAAMQFIDRNQREPFFVYLATNVPHTPLEVDERLAQPYRQMGLNDTFARLYGMIDNLDHNIGRMLAKLDELNLTENTIVLFTSDHGPCSSSRHEGQLRYNANLRGMKGEMYDGGLRVPCWWRWPGHFAPRHDVDVNANPVDLLPTLAAACGAKTPEDRAIDGVNLLPVLQGEADDVEPRETFFQWHRGDVPVRGRNFAVVTKQYKLIRPHEDQPQELYDLRADPYEQHNLASRHADVVEHLRRRYEKWFDEVSHTRPHNFDCPRIHIGTANENPTVLTRQDWRSKTGEGWSDKDEGYWLIYATHSGRYDVTLRFTAAAVAGEAHLSAGNIALTQPVPVSCDSCRFCDVTITAGDQRIDAWLVRDGVRTGVRYVDVFGQPSVAASTQER